MKRKATALMFAAAALHAAQPRIGLTVYDFAGIGEEELALARTEAREVLEDAGVQVVWVAGLEAGERVDYPVIRVRLRASSACMGGKRRKSAHVMGRAYPDTLTSDINGSFIDVFRDDIDTFAASFGVRPGSVLGCVMVHELGHLLLGSGHTPRGLMSGRWGTATIDALQKRRLRFDRRQREQIVLELRDSGQRMASFGTYPRSGT